MQCIITTLSARNKKCTRERKRIEFFQSYKVHKKKTLHKNCRMNPSDDAYNRSARRMNATHGTIRGTAGVRVPDLDRKWLKEFCKRIFRNQRKFDPLIFLLGMCRNGLSDSIHRNVYKKTNLFSNFSLIFFSSLISIIIFKYYAKIIFSENNFYLYLVVCLVIIFKNHTFFLCAKMCGFIP